MTLRSCFRAPLFWILLAAAAMRLAGLFWGLPASDGWDNDGFAPRNFLTALALTYKPGSFFTYPPLHAFWIAIPTLPFSLWVLAHAPSFSQTDIVAAFTAPPVATIFTVVARLISLAMSLGIIWCVAQMAQLLAGVRAGLFAAVACALNMVLVYYGQVSNLDVPYLFWSLLSLLACMRALAAAEPRRFWPAALFAAAAIATKDQAYAIFAFSLPALLLIWFCAGDWPRRNARVLIKVLLAASAVGLALLLLVDGAITNPAGFVKRLAYLAGPASGDFAVYPATLSGRLDALRDMADWFAQGPAWASCLLALLGLGFVTQSRDKSLRIAGLLPLLVIVSFTLCFNLVALRTEARFVLPQAILATVYIGIAADRLAYAARPWIAIAARAGLVLLGLLAVHAGIAVNAAMLFDPRYDAEAWMAAHLRPGDTVETYGQNAFLPRLPAGARLTRIGQGPLAARNPLPGVTELREPFEAVTIRKPRYIVVSAWWARHYTSAQSELGGRQIASPIHMRQFADVAARQYLLRLQAGALDYRLVHVAAPRASAWPPVHIHASLNEAIQIFERR